MKKLVSFTLVVLMLVLAAMPAFAAVRCHHPGCNGTGGNLCAVRYYNQVDTKIREERGTDPANGNRPCVYYVYRVDRDVHAVCNRNSSHTADFHESVIVKKVAYWL